MLQFQLRGILRAAAVREDVARDCHKLSCKAGLAGCEPGARSGFSRGHGLAAVVFEQVVMDG